LNDDETQPTSNVTTAYTTTSHLFKPEEARKIRVTIRQKRARFRWFLAYTMLNNYHLFDLRKQVQSRLARLRIERSNSIDGQSTADAASQQCDVEMEIPESPDFDDYDQSQAEQERTRR